MTSVATNHQASIFSSGTRLLVAATMLLLLSGCGGQRNYAAECDEALSSTPATIDLAVTGEYAYTPVMHVTQDQSAGIEVDWAPAYALTNASEETVCVYDVTVNFAAQRDASGALLDLDAVGGSRLVDIYANSARLDANYPDATMKPPFPVNSDETVFVRFHQHFALKIDGQAALSKTDDHMQVLGPLLDLPTMGDGAYQCVPKYSGLDTTVASSAGTLSHETTNAIMPEGCLLNVPPRAG